jgi:ParB family chromosome partitioning protein
MDKRLGKGLDALISEDASRALDKAKSNKKVESLPLDAVIPNPFQPRKTFGEDEMRDLVNSIKEKGVIQPVIVRPGEKGFELIAGERRWRAAKELSLKEIPAIVRGDIDDASSLEISLIENIQREELNPVEEALAYKELIEHFEYTLEKVGKMVGKNKTTISNFLRLLTLPEDIRRNVVEGRLSMGHAKALLAVASDNRKRELARKIMAKGLSVREAEILSRRSAETKVRVKKTKAPEIVSVEEKLQHKLGTKVSIIQGKKRGRIELQYYSDKDLNRLLSILIGDSDS